MRGESGQREQCLAVPEKPGFRDNDGLDQRLQFVRFAGEWKTYGTLIAGPVRDFNVIHRRDRVRAEVLHRPLVGTMVFLAQAHTTWFVHLAAGRAAFKHAGGSMQLEVRESLLLEPDATKDNCILDGGGELVLIKLECLIGKI